MTLSCPKCKSEKLIKSGFKKGKQGYKCNNCGSETVNPLINGIGKPKREPTGVVCPNCNDNDMRKDGHKDDGKQIYKCRACSRTSVVPLSKPKEQISMKREISKKKRYLITCAQNATPVHKKFLSNLEAYAKLNDAEIIVIPIRYRNPTSLWSKNQEHDEWWDSSIVKYLCDQRIKLSSRLEIMGDIPIQPTNQNPLSDLKTISGRNDAIFAHTTIAREPVAVPGNNQPKIIRTTGCVTLKNYTSTKVGKKSEFNHAFAASVVETDGNDHYVREINALDDGSFIDINTEYKNKNATKMESCAALIMGDSHVDFISSDVEKATFGKSGIISAFNPDILVWHDLLDFYSQNHHHKHDPFTILTKNRYGNDSVVQEVERAFDFVSKNGKGRRNIIVPSNHPDALIRWIKESDWKTLSYENAKLYLELALNTLESSKMEESGASYMNPFSYLGKKMCKNAEFLSRGDAFFIKDILVSEHGDKGINGARGNVSSFARVGVKSVSGHTHEGKINRGSYSVGTSTNTTLEYNRGGLSTWTNTHCIIYQNGKRTLIDIINGKWRL